MYNSSAWAGDCDTTVEEDLPNTKLVCSTGDSLTVNKDILLEKDNSNIN